MVARIVIAVILMAVAALVAWRLERKPSAPGRMVSASDRANVPAQLDRADFTHPDAAWLLVLFSSAHCGGCAEMSTKVSTLDMPDVAVCEVDYERQPELQERYAIDAVPMIVVADSRGVVRGHALGNVPASEIRSVVAAAREAS